MLTKSWHPDWPAPGHRQAALVAFTLRRLQMGHLDSEGASLLEFNRRTLAQ